MFSVSAAPSHEADSLLVGLGCDLGVRLWCIYLRLKAIILNLHRGGKKKVFFPLSLGFVIANASIVKAKREGGGGAWNGKIASSTPSVWVWTKPWEIVKDRGGLCAAVRSVAKSQTRLSDWTTNYLVVTTLFPSPGQGRQLYIFCVRRNHFSLIHWLSIHLPSNCFILGFEHTSHFLPFTQAVWRTHCLVESRKVLWKGRF